MLDSISRVEKVVLLAVGIVVVTAVFLSYLDEAWFRSHFVVEDGVIESMTVGALLGSMLVCFVRLWRLIRHRAVLFLSMTALLGMFFFFAAGEELSWGQRIFNIQSSEFFQQHNAQGETNLHNLVVNGIKINKLVFSTGLGALALLYMVVITPLYHRKPKFQAFVDRFAVPIPQSYQIFAFLLVVAVVELLVGSSKKGEILEFSGAFLIFLTVTYPYNRALFRPTTS